MPVPKVGGPSVRAWFGQLDKDAAWLGPNEADVRPTAAPVDEALPLVLDRIERAHDLIDLQADMVEPLPMLLEPGGHRTLREWLHELERCIPGIEIRQPNGAIEHVCDFSDFEAEINNPGLAGSRDIADDDADMVNSPDVLWRGRIRGSH
jgi:hypothetical protein